MSPADYIEVAEGVPFLVERAYVAGRKLRRGVVWMEGHPNQSQAVADLGGAFLIEGFYVRKSKEQP
jgi:hypothetical protein